MPEGHLIHRIAEQHSQLFAGESTIVESPQGRFSKEAQKLSGSVLEKTDAHGKHLFYHFARDRIIHIHLGLYGKFSLFENPPGPPKGAVRLRMIGRSSGFDLNGPNQCRLINRSQKQMVTDRLGEDPLKSDASPDRVWEKIQTSRRPIGALLLDQNVVAGIGNIYRTEILFLCQINPQTLAVDLTKNQFDEIWQLTCELMELGKQMNRIITRNATATRSTTNPRKTRERFNIYKKPECPNCGKPIYYWTLANRTVYACEYCQPY